MSRLRVNNVGDPTGQANPITLSSPTVGVATWSSPPANMPAVQAPDFLPLTLEPGTAKEEIVWITGYSPGSSSASVIRNPPEQNAGTAATHTAVGWIHGPTSFDFQESVPLVGAALTLFGHSLNVGGGVSGNVLTRGWHAVVAEALRARLWNQAVGGAVLGKMNIARGSSGFGGVIQVLQGLVPHPYNGINWRGAYSSTAYYAYGDGVTSGGNFYVCEGTNGVNNVAPPASPWFQVVSAATTTTASGQAGIPAYNGFPFIPIFFFGGNDIGEVFQGNDLSFLSAMESILSMACASDVFDASNTMITYASGTFASNNYSGTSYEGFGSTFETIPATTGATITFTTPPDWPGGYVDFHFLGVTGAAGALAFTVDGVATNVLSAGTATNTNLVNFGSPSRNFISGSALTTALAAGVAVTNLAVQALADGVGSGVTITVGNPGNTDTFVTSAAVVANATSIPVTSKAPTNAHPINDPVSSGWFNFHNCVRIPTNAGQHNVVATVQASPALSGLYFDGVVLESPNPPPILVPGLWYMPSYSVYWPSRNQNDALVDSWNTDLKNLVAQFPSAYYHDTTQIIRPGAKLSTALTANQAGITSLALQAPGLPYAVKSGDIIAIGSATTQQNVTASGAAAAGALSIPVTSFTSTYAQAVGTQVWDTSFVSQYLSFDNVHPSDLGHQMIAQSMLGALRVMGSKLTTLQAARLTSPSRTDFYAQRYNGTGTILMGTGTANQWGRSTGGFIPQLSISADPGDVIEVNIQGLTDNSTGTSYNVDIATFNPVSGAAINYFSGFTWGTSTGVAYLGADAAGAQATNGIPSLLNDGSTATYRPFSSGLHQYVVQTADLIGGSVNLGIWAKSSAVATRAVLTGTSNGFYWSVKNLGPASFNGDAV